MLISLMSKNRGMAIVGLSVVLSATLLLLGFSSLLISQLEQKKVFEILSDEKAHEANLNAVAITKKLIEINALSRNTNSGTWSAPSYVHNNLWKFQSSNPETSFGMVEYNFTEDKPNSTASTPPSQNPQGNIHTLLHFLNPTTLENQPIRVTTQLQGRRPSTSLVLLTVSVPPTADLKVAVNGGTSTDGPVTIKASDEISLSWSSADSSSCLVSPGNYNALSNSGVKPPPVTATTVFTLTCMNSIGSKSDTVTVVFEKAHPCDTILAANEVDFSLPPPVNPAPAALACAKPIPTSTKVTPIFNAVELSSMLSQGRYRLAANINIPKSWKPIPLSDIELDGAGFSIRGLEQPLFSSIKNSIVKNLDIRSPQIRLTSPTANGNGSLAYSASCTTIQSVRVIGGVVTSSRPFGVGGLFSGMNDSIIIRSGNSANVCGADAGGITGSVGGSNTLADNRGEIIGTVNYGEVTAVGDKGGGLVGSISTNHLQNPPYNFVLSKSSNYGQVRGTGTIAHVGGLIGQAKAAKISILDSQNFGSVSGDYVGGAVGWLLGDLNKAIAIAKLDKIQNSGTISCDTNSGCFAVGGILGMGSIANLTLTNANNTGSINGGSYAAGGIVGDLNVVSGNIGVDSGVPGIVNSGTVNTQNNGARAGGIVGEIDNWFFSSSWPHLQTASIGILGVKNQGIVKSSYSAGGILGGSAASTTETVSIVIKNAQNVGEICSSSSAPNHAAGITLSQSAPPRIILSILNSSSTGKVGKCN